MKATLEYNLPEEQCEFNIASKAMSWASAMWALDNTLRGNIKHAETDSDFIDGVQWARDQLTDATNLYGVSLDDIE